MNAQLFDVNELFDDDYLYFHEQRLAEVSDSDTETIWRLLELEHRAHVLDLACGHGRIANRLAKRGARVVGLDTTPLFLERATADAAEAGLEAQFVKGDMRSLPWADGTFDDVISWFTSFGYFADSENRLVLQEAQRVLRPGGRFLIEGHNLAELLPRWLPTVVVEREGNFLIDHNEFDPTTSRAATKRVIIRDGRTRRFHFSVRLFIAAELRDWLQSAGFHSIHFYDRQGEPLTRRGARMITIAQR
jgi:SAM-dependent methyltransferase